MKIEIIKCLQDNYSYIIIDEENQLACVIDPSEADPIINLIERKKIHLKYILNTHHHYDHIGGNLELKKKYNSLIVGFKNDKSRIPGINEVVENNQIWKGGNFEAKILQKILKILNFKIVEQKFSNFGFKISTFQIFWRNILKYFKIFKISKKI